MQIFKFIPIFSGMAASSPPKSGGRSGRRESPEVRAETERPSAPGRTDPAGTGGCRSGGTQRLRSMASTMTATAPSPVTLVAVPKLSMAM